MADNKNFMKNIPGYIPLSFLEKALNEGYIEVKSDIVMQYFEKLVGHKIYIPKPIDNQFKDVENAALQRNEKSQQSSAPSSAKPMGAAKMPAFMEKGISYDEMYKRATDVSTKIRDNSDVLQKKLYGLSLAARYKDWMTPELFDYLSSNGARAEAELRAACYPARVAFSHRVQKIEGRYWSTPYITIFAPFNAMEAKDNFDIKEDNHAYSFYLTKDREIHVVDDNIERVDTIKNPETREKQRKENLKAWQNSNAEKRVRILNPKTGVEQYALLLTQGTEGWQEKYFFKKGDARSWAKTYDVTSCINNGNVDYDEYWSRGKALGALEETESIGRASITKIPGIVMSEENLQCFEPLYIDEYDKKGKCREIKAPKGYKEYADKGSNAFATYWNQDLMEQAVGYDEMQWGKD